MMRFFTVESAISADSVVDLDIFLFCSVELSIETSFIIC